MTVLQLLPSEIKFTQDTVAMRFQNGNLVNKTCEDIARGYYHVDDLPKIKIYTRRNKYYSLDNRRLYIFRVLEKLHFIEEIEVKLVERNNYRAVTTQNRGCHVTLRGGKDSNGGRLIDRTYKHCSCNERSFIFPEWWSQQNQCHINQLRYGLVQMYKTKTRIKKRKHKKKNSNDENKVYGTGKSHILPTTDMSIDLGIFSKVETAGYGFTVKRHQPEPIKQAHGDSEASYRKMNVSSSCPQQFRHRLFQETYNGRVEKDQKNDGSSLLTVAKKLCNAIIRLALRSAPFCKW